MIAEPIARNSDPVASWEAAESLTVEVLNGSEAAVLNILRDAPSPLTDEQIYFKHIRARGVDGYSPSRMRTARSRLARLGIIEEAGLALTRSGRNARTWRVSNDKN